MFSLFYSVHSLVLKVECSCFSEGNCGKEDWQKLYGKCSGNEIYEIQLYKSIFFKDYCGKSFSYASFNAHRRHVSCLLFASNLFF